MGFFTRDRFGSKKSEWIEAIGLELWESCVGTRMSLGPSSYYSAVVWKWDCFFLRFFLALRVT